MGAVPAIYSLLYWWHRLGVLAMLLGNGDIHVVSVPFPSALAAAVAMGDLDILHEVIDTGVVPTSQCLLSAK